MNTPYRHIYTGDMILDINPDLRYGSSVACKEAIGYIRGTCMMDPVVKPHSWAGSNVADASRHLLPQKKEVENV